MRRLQANGTTIAYARIRAGPPIVLMGGAQAHHSMLARPAIERAGCRTDSAYHRHACGRTCKPERGSSLEDVASDAVALIKGLGCDIGDAAPGSLLAQSRYRALALRCGRDFGGGDRAGECWASLLQDSAALARIRIGMKLS